MTNAEILQIDFFVAVVVLIAITTCAAIVCGAALVGLRRLWINQIKHARKWELFFVRMIHKFTLFRVYRNIFKR